MKKPATTAVKIDELIASRWSPRAFDPDFLINDEIAVSYTHLTLRTNREV